MAVVRRDEPAIRQLSTDGLCNVSITRSITLHRYTEEERMAFLPSPTVRQKDWRAIHRYQGKDKIMTFATLINGTNLEPGGLLAWLIVGLVAGFLASRVIRGGGYGLIGDIIVGIVGAFIGGWPRWPWDLLWPDRDYCDCLYWSLYSPRHLTRCHWRSTQAQSMATAMKEKLMFRQMA